MEAQVSPCSSACCPPAMPLASLFPSAPSEDIGGEKGSHGSDLALEAGRGRLPPKVMRGGCPSRGAAAATCLFDMPVPVLFICIFMG